MSANIGCSKLNDFREYLANTVHSSKLLRPTFHFEVLCLINQFNSYKNCDLDGINAKFAQLAVEAIAPALCLLFNTFFKYGFFPTCLKEAKVVPVFKFGDKQKLTNYRPMLILS